MQCSRDGKRPSRNLTNWVPRRETVSPAYLGAPRRRRFPWKLFIALLALALALQAIVIAILVRQQKDPSSPPRAPKRPPQIPGTTRRAPSRRGSRRRGAGQYRGAQAAGTAAGRPVPRRRAGLAGKSLPAVARQLGAPSRTNRVAQTGAIIYVFDRHGLLLYAQPDAGRPASCWIAKAPAATPAPPRRLPAG